MAGTFDKPQRKSAAVTEWLDHAREVADSGLTETTQAHRDDGFLSAEAANPNEFNYIEQRRHRWLRRNGVTLVASHRTASIAVGGAVTIGDTRRLTVSTPAAFTVDYATDATDATNNDIAEHWAEAINADATASIYMTASSSGANVIIEWLTGGEQVAWAVSQPVVVGTPTTVLTETVTDSGMLYRPADDDAFGTTGFCIGSTQLDDLASGTDGDLRCFYDIQTGSFRAGWCEAAQWDTRGTASTAFGRNCQATGDYSLAVGSGSVASGSEAFAGAGATASNTRALAWGSGAAASGSEATAIGNGSSATGSQGVAIGASATTSTGVAVGPSSQAGAGCIALGDTASATTGADNTAVGADSTALGDRAVAIGSNTAGVGDDSICGGTNAQSVGDGSTSIGMNSDATGAASTALGFGAQATADGALAIGAATSTGGQSTTASADQAIAIGTSTGVVAEQTVASDPYAIAIGTGAEANDGPCIALGYYPEAHQPGMLAWSAEPILSAPTPAATDRGSAQVGILTRTEQTSGASTVVLGGPTVTVEVRNGYAMHAVGDVLVTTASATRWYAVQFGARNTGGSVTVTGASTDSGTGDALAVTVGTPTAVGSTGVKIDVTGIAATGINWICRLRLTEVLLP